MCFAECQIDCLQRAFSLKIRLVLDLIQRDCKPRCFLIGLMPSFLAARGFAAGVIRFSVQ